MHSHVQLLSHTLSNIELRPVEDIALQNDRVPFAATRQKLAWEQAKNNPRAWRIKLRVELVKDPVFPQLYEGFVEMIGEVALSEDVPEDRLEAVARIGGGGLLYSSIREWIATLTARSINGMVEIPSVNPGIFAPKDSGKNQQLGKQSHKETTSKIKTATRKPKTTKMKKTSEKG